MVLIYVLIIVCVIGIELQIKDNKLAAPLRMFHIIFGFLALMLAGLWTNIISSESEKCEYKIVNIDTTMALDSAVNDGYRPSAEDFASMRIIDANGGKPIFIKVKRIGKVYQPNIVTWPFNREASDSIYWRLKVN
jgi:hypothetical protein